PLPADHPAKEGSDRRSTEQPRATGGDRRRGSSARPRDRFVFVETPTLLRELRWIPLHDPFFLRPFTSTITFRASIDYTQKTFPYNIPVSRSCWVSWCRKCS